MSRYLSRLFNKRLYYIVESAEWSIKWDGRYISEKINDQFPLTARLRENPANIRNSIVHFGSRNLYFMTDAYRGIHKSNKVVFTWFHGTENDVEFIKALPEGSRNADLIHTSCTTSRNQLIEWGAEADKIVVVPLGVETSLFKPVNALEKERRKQQANIPPGHIVVGSFQKDGNGWKDGLEPKLIKGPDTFCNVVEQLSKRHLMFVLLTGPARGYVKRRLDNAGIPYLHTFLKNYHDVAYYYNLLDLYLISSRAEGGPKALLEAWASGIPVVSFPVGMCADLIQHEKNGLIAEPGSESALLSSAERLIEDTTLSQHIAQRAQRAVQQYSWRNIAKRYYNELYSKLL